MVKDEDLTNFNYDQFKNVIVNVLGEIREKIKISEDDIKTIFFILDS